MSWYLSALGHLRRVGYIIRHVIFKGYLIFSDFELYLLIKWRDLEIYRGTLRINLILFWFLILFQGQKYHTTCFLPTNVTFTQILRFEWVPIFHLLHSKPSLKWKYGHFGEIFVTGYSGSCHFDNFRQWRKFHQNDSIIVEQWTVNLTLNVRGPSYLGLTRSVSWLLMPWFLTSPGHQQPWYWLCRICRSRSYLRKDFKYLCHINVE